MVFRALSVAAAAAVALLVATPAQALDQQIYGLNYDMRQGPDWDTDKCKDSDTIAADLKILSTVTSNVRTYSLSDCDVSYVLTAAKDLSLTVWLGIWVSEDSTVYDAEVAAFKELITAGLIDDNVVGINVGSEAVYRGDITAEQAIEYVTDFRKVMSDNDVSVPVSITDIVDTFISYPDMITAGDIVTINQFPYWEAIEVDGAVAQFNSRIKPLIELAGDMEVIISETGWPDAGTAENGSVASTENAARYLNDFYWLATDKGWKYYYFAGFDTPYKKEQEVDDATVEAHFGIFDEDGNLKSEFESLTFTRLSDYSTSSSGSSDTISSSSTSDGTTAGTVHAGSSSGTSGTSSTSSGSSSTATGSESGNLGSSGASSLAAAGLSALAGAVSLAVFAL
jgi:glucan 1,3-beta-glucosidase